MTKHNFHVEKCMNDITVMYCTNCGKSYNLVHHTIINSMAWQEMAFEDVRGNKVEHKNCEEEQES